MSIRHEQLEHLRENFTKESLLTDNIVDAMSDYAFIEIYEHICRMWSIEPKGQIWLDFLEG